MRRNGPASSDGLVLSQSSEAEHGVWKVAFYTPQEVVMTANKAEQAGYSTRLTPSRLVMRSPYNTAETHSEEVSGADLGGLDAPTHQSRLKRFLGGRDTHGSHQGERLLQGAPRDQHCPLGGCLSHR